MGYIDEALQLLQLSNVAQVFGLEPKNLLFLLFATLVCGWICLTFQYTIVRPNKNWLKLPVAEKAIFSVIVGFFNTITSLFVLVIFQLFLSDVPIFSGSFAQLAYTGPFLYFWAYSKFWSLSTKYAKNKNHFEFIRNIIWDSFIVMIVCLIIIAVLSITFITQQPRVAGNILMLLFVAWVLWFFVLEIKSNKNREKVKQWISRIL